MSKKFSSTNRALFPSEQKTKIPPKSNPINKKASDRFKQTTLANQAPTKGKVLNLETFEQLLKKDLINEEKGMQKDSHLFSIVRNNLKRQPVFSEIESEFIQRQQKSSSSHFNISIPRAQLLTQPKFYNNQEQRAVDDKPPLHQNNRKRPNRGPATARKSASNFPIFKEQPPIFQQKPAKITQQQVQQAFSQYIAEHIDEIAESLSKKLRTPIKIVKDMLENRSSSPQDETKQSDIVQMLEQLTCKLEKEGQLSQKQILDKLLLTLQDLECEKQVKEAGLKAWTEMRQQRSNSTKRQRK